MKNRIFALLLVLVLVISATGCGNSASSGEEAKTAATVDEAAKVDAETAEEGPTDFTFVEEKSEEVVEENFGAMLEINMLENGDFSDGNKNWGTYICQGGSGTFLVQNDAAVVKVINSGSVDYSVQLYYDGFKLINGGVYRVSMDVDSTLARTLGARIQLNGGDYFGYFDDVAPVSEGLCHLSWEFKMEQDSDLAPRFCLNLGTPKNGQALPEHTLIIDNVEVTLVDDSDVIKDEVVDLSKKVNLNQVGFLPNARKTVVVKSMGIEAEYKIIDEAGNEVYKAYLSGPVKSAASGEEVYQGDFTKFNTPGKYTIRISNGEESYPFEIKEGVYDELLKDTFLFLYKQRCGVAVEAGIAGPAAHGECHTTDALIYGTDKYVEVNGGWHDAGDYGRYVCPGATTVADLFHAYEDFPEVWSADDLGIPESGNGIPDILDEARFELDWMLKMQDEESGGVYHKVSCRDFPGFVMPEKETDELVLAPISTTATGDFAAVMAMASTLYKDIDEEFSKNALEAALKAWGYLEEHKKSAGFKNPKEIVTGEYPDSDDTDERYWAACELLKITGEQKYKDFVEHAIGQFVPVGLGWAGMGSYGNMTYLSLDSSLQNPEMVEKVTKKIRQRALEYQAASQKDGYMSALGSVYPWGSNMTVCEDAREALFAAKYAPDLEGLDVAAYDQLSYLLGQNCLSYCYVSGFGTLSPENIHHRPSMAAGKAVTGMLVGGPNGSWEDPYAKAVLSGLPPAKSYADNAQSYSTNEVTIYWNSPFVYVLSAVINSNK